MANFYSYDVSAYSINPTTGALTAVGTPVTAGSELKEPVSVTVEPGGKFAYAVNLGSTILAYSINPATGALTNAGAFSQAGAGFARSIVISQRP